MGKNIRSPSMEPHADRRPTYNEVWPCSPRGLLTTLQSLPQCHAALGAIPSTLAWVDQSPVSQCMSQQPQSGYTLHNCTTTHVTQGREEYDSMIPQGTDQGLDLWQTIVERTLCDLEEAFDCINRHILLSKLSYCRITCKSHTWIRSYLGNKYKSLVINFNHNTFFDQGIYKTKCSITINFRSFTFYSLCK